MTIAAVGRLKDGGERTLADRYIERLSLGRTIGLGPVREVEIGEGRQASGGERREHEGRRLVQAVDTADVVVLLDAKGRSMTSEAFAQWLAERRDAGARHAAFLIGGPDGHGNVARERATFVLSFGQMTWPHGLVRVLLAEQLYRAVTILAGHPYHRS
jgi:23S rRNA (pseudouridine1915-N3)-methyltransferase